MIKYKNGYKYKVEEDFTVMTRVIGYKVSHEYYELNRNGELKIKRNFCWNGANFVPDIKTVMKASCVHDCLYQMIRLNLIPDSQRNEADETFKEVCLSSGMNSLLANGFYKGLRIFGSNSAYGRENPIQVSP